MPWGHATLSTVVGMLLGWCAAAGAQPATTAPATLPANPTTAPVEPLAPSPAEAGAAFALQPGECVVFLGDELTEVNQPRNSHQFPMLVESFVTVRYPDIPLRFVNAGWAYDTAHRALLRLERDVLALEPNHVVVCLGLNDPDFLALDAARLESFRSHLTQIVERCRQAGARVWLMTPPRVDEEHGRRARVIRDGVSNVVDLQAIQYDATMQRYAQVVREVAHATKTPCADWSAAVTAVAARLDRTAAVGLTTDGLHPSARSHALAAVTLLRTWNAEPISVNVEVHWAAPEVKVTAHTELPAPSITVTDDGTRDLRIPQCPLPWPMPTGRFDALGEDWEATRMCRVDLRVIEPPERGVVITRQHPPAAQAPAAIVNADELAKGVNLATLPILLTTEPAQHLFNDIGTKNLYHYTVWRRLKPEPPQEPELAEAHQKLIDTWLAYEAGYEKLIRKHPKRMDLHLLLRENVKNEQLPANPPSGPESIEVQPGPILPKPLTTQSAPAP